MTLARFSDIVRSEEALVSTAGPASSGARRLMNNAVDE